MKKKKVNEEEEEGDASSNYVRLDPLPMEHDYENCCCKLNMPDSDSDDEYEIDKDCWSKYLQQLNESESNRHLRRCGCRHHLHNRHRLRSES